MKTIIVNGKPGSGKDTFVNNVIMTIPNSTAISTIDQEKIAAKILGWNEKKDAQGRRLLSNLKKAKLEYNQQEFDCPMDKYVSEKIQWAQENAIGFLFVHCREPEEIKKIVENTENCITVLVKNPRVDEKEVSNTSDEYMNDYDYDYIIHNDENFERLYRDTISFIHLALNYTSKKE